MTILYQSSTDNNDSYLSSYPRCSNCTSKEHKSKGNRKLETNQIRVITDYESGEMICSICGMVISDKIEDAAPEWRNFDQKNLRYRMNIESNANKQSMGSPFSLARHDKGLFTVIGERDNDAHGKLLDPLVRHSIHKIRMYDVRTQLNTHNHRNLKKAFVELDKLRSKLGLSDFVIEKTAYLYRKAQARGVVTGRTTPTMVAASLYIACREMTVPKTLKEIAKAGDIRLKTLSKDYRILITELDLKVPNNDPRHCIFKVGNTI
ncbi:MAG: hypothetical protein GEU26_18975, partial [Nitrososphaeraceae archaeon]|nr:hypothetical protein [Nitrososphaeraceae archaeon]